MVIDKVPLPEDPTPTDAPPSYDTVSPPPGPSSSSFRPDEKSGSTNPYELPEPSTSPQSPQCPSSALKGKSPTRASSSWFGFGQAARAAKEVKSTVTGLVRDVVQNSSSDVAASLAILESCSDACRARSVSFSALLQEKSIEGHSPIYWAIVKRPPAGEAPQGPDVLSGLLSMASPLTDATISEIRLACLDTSDQTLFQHLRRSPAFAPLDGTDQMLLGASVPPDDIEVEDVPGDEGAFVVRFRIVAFQKRMRVTKHIHLEFIARSRIWRLSFLIVQTTTLVVGSKPFERGKWIVTLSLLEHSPPTWIDSRILIEDPQSTATHSDTPSDSPTTSSNPLGALVKSSSTPKLKPTIELRIRTTVSQLATHGFTHDIGASLDESLMGSSLQYEGSSYINSDGSLTGRLEAKLIRSDSAECIIC